MSCTEAFDPVELAINQSEVNQIPFQQCFITILNDYENHLTQNIPPPKKRRLKRKVPRNAVRLGDAKKKAQAINHLWENTDKIRAMPSLLDEIKGLLQEDFCENLKNGAQESGKRLVTLFKNNLWLTYKTLVIKNLSLLVDESIDEDNVPEIYRNIIDGHTITDVMLRKLQRDFDFDAFYGIIPLHIAALSGNLNVIKWLEERDFPYFDERDRDVNDQSPFEYAVIYCRDNGVNLDLLESVYDPKDSENVLNIIDNQLRFTSDKSLVLNHLMCSFENNDIIEEYDQGLFIEAFNNGYEILRDKLLELSDFSPDVKGELLDYYSDIDESSIEEAQGDTGRWFLANLDKAKELCGIDLWGLSSSEYESSDYESDYEFSTFDWQ